MKAIRYVLLFLPIAFQTYYKYMYDTTHGMQWVQEWKLWVLLMPIIYLVLVIICNLDKSFRIWCESVAAFMLVNNVWDLFSEIHNIPFRMASGVDSPGRWLLF